MADIWLVTANSNQATIFTAASPIAPLVELVTLTNPDARAKNTDLVSDRPGRTFDSGGTGRHAMEVEVDAKEQAQIRFAKTVADQLERGRIDNAFARLVVVAAPAFLGLLRSNFEAPLASLVSLEIDKDYTTLKPDELRAQLPERL